MFQRKLNFVFNTLTEDIKKRRERVNEKKEKERTKDKEIKFQIKVLQKRDKEIDYGFSKTSKGEVMTAKLNGTIIGKYNGPGIPGSTQKKIASNEFNWDL